FLARVSKELGLQLEVIDRETEATLAATGCTPLIDPAAEGVVLFDIGGGSSELVRLARSHKTMRGPPLPHMRGWISLRHGVVTLAERFGGINVTRDVYEAMVQEVGGMIAPFAHEHASAGLHGVHMLGTSGTVTTIAGVHLNLKRYDRNRVAGCAILEAIRRAFPVPRLRVADRGLREGMLVQMMRDDGVWGGGEQAAAE